MSCVADTLPGGWRIGPEDGITELSTSLILPKGGADARETQDTAKSRGRDGFEGLAARGRGGEDFGQVVKAGRFHVLSDLSMRQRCLHMGENNAKITTIRVNQSQGHNYG